MYFCSYSIATIFDKKPAGDLRPYVSVKVGSLNLCGLLDSGSAVSILGNNSHSGVIASTGVPVCPSNNTSFVTASGHRLNTTGYINLPITFEGKTHILKMYIIPSVTSSLILGVDFWKKFQLLSKFSKSISLTKSTSQISSVEDSTKMLHSFSELSASQQTIANDVIAQYKSISSEVAGLGRTHLTEHRIDTGDSPPIRQRYYRLPPEKLRIICHELDEMVQLGVVEPCESPWSSPVLLTPKKDGKLRFCLDSRKLNSITRKDAYKLPYISEILDNLKNAKYLSSIDLSKAFWQTPIAETDRDKTAFYVPSRGTFRFVTMPFGLTNAPATQQRLVDKLFYGPEFENSVFAFLDDIILVSGDFQGHISLLNKVFTKLKSANLTINLEKSVFFRNELKYLGYIVNSKGLQVDPGKVDAILNFPTPTNKKEVKRFLGTASWYRRFVPNFSSIADPLNKLTSTSKKKASTFAWSKEADEAFNRLKECLVSAPTLSCPDYDKPFEVHTDASDYGIGALLTQTIDGVEHPIAYMSKSLSAAERNYSITEREALAVLAAIEHWRCYIDNGLKFTVYTDHSALKWFLNLNNPTGRLARWGVRLSAYNFEIKHRRGSDNVVPDALSRACPISAIGSDVLDHPKTTDQWYLNIFKKCHTAPSSIPNYIVKNGALYRLMKSKCSLLKEFQWKEVVPKENRTTVINTNHTEPTAGHLGIFKTYKRLTLRYYWPGMHADVVKFISTCDACISHKHQNHAILGEMGRPKVCSRPFQTISIDLVGPLPPTRKQNTHIFVVTCCFSKYCLLFPIRRASAEIITKLLEENVFLVHGIPSTVLSDNGKQFVSITFKSMLNKYKIPNLHYTPKYSPHVNTVERYNKTIMTAVSTFIDNNDHRGWDQLLPQIQFAINSSVNEVTGFTPSFLVYGRELVTCGSHYIDAECDDVEDIVYQPRDAYADNLGCLSNIFNKVQSLLLQAHSRNSKTYNLRRLPAEFNVGDVVWKKTFYQSDKDKRFSKKLAPKYLKCKVIGKRSPLVYELSDDAGNNIGCWHIKDLKLVNYAQ